MHGSGGDGGGFSQLGTGAGASYGGDPRPEGWEQAHGVMWSAWGAYIGAALRWWAPRVPLRPGLARGTLPPLEFLKRLVVNLALTGLIVALIHWWGGLPWGQTHYGWVFAGTFALQWVVSVLANAPEPPQPRQPDYPARR
jgi:hypothetical protein